eukprot:CAMPEP_0114557036 /NCGR_PEP_ID=MMETSP0114-20121206/9610_1 /TAXON_ID=31324 /ORGANISM="Goniomonas sp, Strain m" /LENGTH=408 /DNA_ID=CAMNT_0001742285 /DNA_START=178 /DNA_END=1404 /DNA_ORIENTATION=+
MTSDKKEDGSQFSHTNFQAQPVFVLSERFLQQHPVKFRKPVESPEVKSEELNFCKLAIKFSQTLSKDVASAATRRLIAKLGQAMGRGAEVLIDFGVGRLYSRDKQAFFVFDPKYCGAESEACVLVGGLDKRSGSYRGVGTASPSRSNVGFQRASDNSAASATATLPALSSSSGPRLKTGLSAASRVRLLVSNGANEDVNVTANLNANAPRSSSSAADARPAPSTPLERLVLSQEINRGSGRRAGERQAPDVLLLPEDKLPRPEQRPEQRRQQRPKRGNPEPPSKPPAVITMELGGEDFGFNSELTLEARDRIQAWLCDMPPRSELWDHHTPKSTTRGRLRVSHPSNSGSPTPRSSRNQSPGPSRWDKITRGSGTRMSYGSVDLVRPASTTSEAVLQAAHQSLIARLRS